MSDKTINLQLPYLYTNQAQKEVSVNESLTILDTVWNAGVITKTLATPPGSPILGDAYIVAATATGAWLGKEKNIAYYNNGWKFITPKEGITIWVNDENILYSFDGTNWIATISSVASVNGLSGAVTLTTSNISEGSNLYYTDERVDDRVGTLIVAGTGISKNYDDTANTLTLSVTAGGAPASATYVTLTNNGSLSNERTLAVSSNLSLTDGDANNAATISTAALTGDVTTSSNSFATTIANNAVTTTKVNNNAITYAKLQQASAYSMIVNNTNAAANFSEVTYKDVAEQAYTGTITWTGTTPPSGTTNHRYKWQQIGKLIQVTIILNYGTAGSALTSVTMTLPTDMPNPIEWTGLGAANEKLFPGVGYLDTTTTGSPGNARAGLFVNATDTGYLFNITAGSTNAKFAYIELFYFAV